mgnify:CR=1 FL=1
MHSHTLNNPKSVSLSLKEYRITGTQHYEAVYGTRQSPIPEFFIPLNGFTQEALNFGLNSVLERTATKVDLIIEQVFSNKRFDAECYVPHKQETYTLINIANR